MMMIICSPRPVRVRVWGQSGAYRLLP